MSKEEIFEQGRLLLVELTSGLSPGDLALLALAGVVLFWTLLTLVIVRALFGFRSSRTRHHQQPAQSPSTRAQTAPAAPVAPVAPGAPVAQPIAPAEPARPPRDESDVLYPLRRPDGSITLRKTEIERLDEIGSGGEAVVYRFPYGGEEFALKIFRQPNDPYYEGDTEDERRTRRSAERRMTEYHEKLGRFPAHASDRVINPLAVVRDPRGHLLGYAMRFVSGTTAFEKYVSSIWRKKNGVSKEDVAALLIDLHDTVVDLHREGVVIGDFKPENCLVKDGKVFVVDAESMAYAGFMCHSFSDGYVDPLACDQKLDYCVLNEPYSDTSDWYSFSVIVFECIVGCKHFEGFHRPDFGAPVDEASRPLREVSLFDHDMHPPALADLKALTGDLHQYLYQVFEQRKRGIFPRPLLEALCTPETLLKVNERSLSFWQERHLQPIAADVSRSPWILTPVFSGEILTATTQDGELRYIERSGDNLNWQDGKLFIGGYRDQFRWTRLYGETLHAGIDENSVVVVQPGAAPIKVTPDKSLAGKLVVRSDGEETYFVKDGRLRAARDEKTKLTNVSDTPGLWLGPRFGLVTELRDGRLISARLFDAKKKRIAYCEELPHIRGEITRANAYLSECTVWLFLEAEFHGELFRYAVVINEKGELLTCGMAKDGDDTWLGTRGVFFASESEDGVPFIQVLTDRGVELIEVRARQFEHRELLEFPAVEGFAVKGILSTSNGLVLWGKTGVFKLEPKPAAEEVEEKTALAADAQGIDGESAVDRLIANVHEIAVNPVVADENGHEQLAEGN